MLITPHLLGNPAESEVRIESLEAPAGTRAFALLGRDGDLDWKQEGADLLIRLPGDLPEAPAHSL